MALLADFLNVVDQADMGKAPNMTQLTICTVAETSESTIPAHAMNSMLDPGIGIDSQRVAACGGYNLLFVAKTMSKWIAATAEYVSTEVAAPTASQPWLRTVIVKVKRR